MEHLKDLDYLGDAVYVGHNGHSIELRTSDGEHVSDPICLDPDTLAALLRYGKRVGINPTE